jgi:hypothetical protein
MTTISGTRDCGSKERRPEMLVGVASLVCLALFFSILSQWADHLDEGPAWLFVGGAILFAGLACLNTCIQMIG